MLPLALRATFPRRLLEDNHLTTYHYCLNQSSPPAVEAPAAGPVIKNASLKRVTPASLTEQDDHEQPDPQ
jgi:hypothetical protein